MCISAIIWYIKQRQSRLFATKYTKYQDAKPCQLRRQITQDNVTQSETE